MGALSAKYESHTSTCSVNALIDSAIMKNDLGGASYGKFQLSTKTGGFKEFLNFLEKNFVSFYTTLINAGGLKAASLAEGKFVKTWQSLARDEAFCEAEYEFVKQNYFLNQASRINDTLNFNILEHSQALQEVLWSVACQHGNGALTIFKNAFAKIENLAQTPEADIIKAIYAERSRVWQYFRSSPEAIKESVKNRFKSELSDALAMLLQE